MKRIASLGRRRVKVPRVSRFGAIIMFIAAASAAQAFDLPPGTEGCDLAAWSTDIDPSGLDVRAEPSTNARVLGKLPPPFRYRSSADGPEDGYRTEFRIIGYRDGWVLIDGAKPPGQRYEDESTFPRRYPKPYTGRGWVPISKAGASFANEGTRMGGLFDEPREDARWTPAKDAAAQPIDPGGGGPKRILACKGRWALVESPDGAKGWWRGLCSNQVASCN